MKLLRRITLAVLVAVCVIVALPTAAVAAAGDIVAAERAECITCSDGNDTASCSIASQIRVQKETYGTSAPPLESGGRTIGGVSATEISASYAEPSAVYNKKIATVYEDNTSTVTVLYDATEGIYTLTRGDSVYVSTSLSEALAATAEAGDCVFFDNVTVNTHLAIEKNLTLSGALVAHGGITVGADSTVIEALDLTLERCDMRQRRGRLEIKSGNITVNGEGTIILDRSSEAAVILSGGSITKLGTGAAVTLRLGTFIARGGSISCPYGIGIESRAALYLASDARVEGGSYGVVAYCEPHLSYGGSYLTSPISVQYMIDMPKGGFYPLMLDASASSAEMVTAYAGDGEQIEARYFDSSPYTDERGLLACYLPYRAEFRHNGETVFVDEFIGGELIEAPVPPSLVGYTFSGWRRDSISGEAFSFGDPISSDIVLYAAYLLTSPEFMLSGIDAEYSEAGTRLAFSSLTHPLSAEGSFSFVWYKDGCELAASGETIAITHPRDSGSYTCKITFTHMHNSISVITPPVAVTVHPCKLLPPAVADLTYNGAPQLPEVEESRLWYAEGTFVTDAGSYTVRVTVTDRECYTFEGGSSIDVPFSVLPAENRFTSPLTVRDVYEGQSISFTAEAEFGIPVFLYSSNGSDFSETVPTLPGIYYVIAAVSGTQNYGALATPPTRFTVIEEIAVGIKVTSPPYKTSYSAFDKVDLTGAVITVTYNSGRCESLPATVAQIEYPNGECLLADGGTVRLCYLGTSVPLALEVAKREYDIGGAVLPDTTEIYDGTRKTVPFSLDVTGQDGIPLGYTVRGGGTDAGEYLITVIFTTQSPNYIAPAPLTATLTVLPMPVECSWGSLSFVYDGAPKLPTVSAKAQHGLVLYPTVSGSGTAAGQYLATATVTDKNYTLTNNTATFEITRRVLDLSGAYWSDAELTYSGKEQGVRLFGLPDEVTVLGYVNAAFTDAGKYLAEAKLGFDSHNYECPERLTCDWEIAAAEYDMSSVSFVDREAVYDGSEHLPSLIGTMPTGYDGSSPTPSFSRGAIHVADGRVEVKVTFTSGSKNYLPPSPMVAYIQILPMPVDVVWSGLEAVYNGTLQAPVATAKECLISVSGGGIDAGEYVAVAESLSPDHKVREPRCRFVIAKRENEWLSAPYCLDIYEGGEARVYGEAIFGNTELRFFTDPELTSPTVTVSSPGTYYCTLSVPESKNYLALTSGVMSFSVIEIRPIALEAELGDAHVVAMSQLDLSAMRICLLNNDGSRTLLSADDITVVYENGSTVTARDTSVTLRAFGYEIKLAVSPRRATYDTSGCKWINNHKIYTGEPISAELVGLPDGVVLAGYKLASATEVGSYKLEAILEYDSVNYYPPEIPEAWLVIKPLSVPLPTLAPLVYNGKEQVPTVAESELYSVYVERGTSAGTYRVTLTLNDSKNYVFEGGSGELYYTILPRAVTLEVGRGGGSYTVTVGEIVSGDSLGEEYYTEEGMVYLRASNPNYAVTVVPGEARDYFYLWLILILLVPILLLIAYVLIFRREQLMLYFAASGDEGEMGASAAPAADASSATPPEVLDTLLSVDVIHANELITDSTARTLITDDEEKVISRGRRRAVVNLDTLCEAFLPGETVDINEMKARGLIREDAIWVKVLARGVTDRPLIIRANSFSLAAVKMIALTGGEAHRVKTQRG